MKETTSTEAVLPTTLNQKLLPSSSNKTWLQKNLGFHSYPLSQIAPLLASSTTTLFRAGPAASSPLPLHLFTCHTSLSLLFICPLPFAPPVVPSLSLANSFSVLHPTLNPLFLKPQKLLLSYWTLIHVQPQISNLLLILLLPILHELLALILLLLPLR